METVLMYGVGGTAMASIAVYYLYLIVCGIRHLFFFLLLRTGGVQSGLLVLQDNIEPFDELRRRLQD